MVNNNFSENPYDVLDDSSHEDMLERIAAERVGLTVKQYKVFEQLKTNEEMEAYLKEHSTTYNK